MTTLNAARAALESRLLALPGITPAQIAWPGIVYKPPTSSLWYKPSLIPTQTLSEFGGGTHPQGAYQVSVFAKPGPNGTVPLHAAGEALVSHFSRVALTASVHSGVPEIGPVLQEPDWLQLPVTIPFICL